jgi:hypothetical protein
MIFWDLHRKSTEGQSTSFEIKSIGTLQTNTEYYQCQFLRGFQI